MAISSVTQCGDWRKREELLCWSDGQRRVANRVVLIGGNDGGNRWSHGQFPSSSSSSVSPAGDAGLSATSPQPPPHRPPTDHKYNPRARLTSTSWPRKMKKLNGIRSLQQQQDSAPPARGESRPQLLQAAALLQPTPQQFCLAIDVQADQRCQTSFASF